VIARRSVDADEDASWAESQSRTLSNRFGDAQLRRRNSTATGTGARPAMTGASSSSSFSRGSKAGVSWSRYEPSLPASDSGFIASTVRRTILVFERAVEQHPAALVRLRRPSLRSGGSSLSCAACRERSGGA